MKTTTFAIAAIAAGSATAQQQAWGQCGGQGWSGLTTCVSGYTCSKLNDFYSQCVPGGSGGGGTTTKATTTAKPTTGTTTRTSPPTTTTTASGGGGGGGGKVQYAGINIAGFDFGCTTDGSCDLTSTYDVSSIGTSQMQHFVKDDGLNTFRLPVAWQYLVKGNLGGTLDSTNLATYDKLVQGCLSSGAALCIVDVHNYARWNGAIIGQGGPTNAQFASLWSQLAKKYGGNSKIAFGVMNEPHDLTVSTWADTVQAAVTAIRQAGGNSNLILLPGSDYTSAGAFISNGSGAALLKVKNPDGSTTNLIFDVHKYLDSDNSGTHAECTTDNAQAFTTLGQWLEQNNRKAILSETGGGASTQSCLTDVCAELDVLNKYSDVYLGWVGWGAGGFDTTYVLTETPSGSPGSYKDQPLVTQCIAGKFKR